MKKNRYTKRLCTITIIALAVCIWIAQLASAAPTGQEDEELCFPDLMMERDVTALQWSPDGLRLMTSTYAMDIGHCYTDVEVNILDITTGQTLPLAHNYTVPIWAVAWRPLEDSIELMTGDHSGYIHHWDTTTGELKQGYRLSELPIVKISWNANYTRFAAGGYDNILRVVDTTGQVVNTLDLGGSDYPGLATGIIWLEWHPTDDIIALSQFGGEVQLRDASTLQLIRTIAATSEEIATSVWSPDGSRLATSGDNYTIQIWDPTTGQRTALLEGHSNRAEIFSWSPDGTQLVSAGRDGTVRIWDVLTGQQVKVLYPENLAAVSRVDWSTNGDIAIGGRVVIDPPGSSTNVPVIRVPPKARAGTDQVVLSPNGVPVSINLDGSASSDADGTIVSYVWAENGVEIATGVNPQVTLAVGVHTITLTVTDDDGATDSDEVVITVNPPATSSVLDDFNRSDGAVGSNWSGDTSSYGIVGNQLVGSGQDKVILWNANPFGAAQEAAVTIVDTGGSGDSTFGVVLKSQSVNTWTAGSMGVSYSTSDDAVDVWSYTPSQGVVQHGQSIAETFGSGDRLRVYARADGVVEIYRNETLIGTQDVSSWPHATGGGYIGLSITIGNPIVDDFDGGDVVIAGMLDDFNRSDGAVGSNWSGDTGSYGIVSNQLAASGQDKVILWNASLFGAAQEAAVTIVDTGGTVGSAFGLILKAQSSSNWMAGILGVSYETSSENVTIWSYAPGQGVVQHGQSIAETFGSGDRLRVYARADGVVEIYRNETLIGTQDVSSWAYATNGGYIGLSTTTGNPVIDDFDGGNVN